MGIVLLALLATTPAPAGAPAGPHTCVAVWQGPTSTCPWTAELEAKASGRSESSAERSALLRMRVVLGASVQARMTEAEGTMAAVEAGKLRACLKLPSEEVHVTCVAQPQLAEPGLCYADLPEDPCWQVDMHVVDGVGWQAQEQARVAVCDEVEAELDGRVSDPAQQLRCKARCLTSVRVRCH